MRSEVVKTDVPDERMPWAKIAGASLAGVVVGLAAVLTTAGVNGWALNIASLLDVTAGLAIIGGLWAATFFSPEH